MKLLSLAAAGLVSLTALAPMAATAQTRVVTERTVTRTHTGPAFERHRTHRVCRVTVRHGHRIRTCRTVRY